MLNRTFLSALLAILTLSQAVLAKDLYRILYSDDPILKQGTRPRRFSERFQTQQRRMKQRKLSSVDARYGQERDPKVEEAYGSFYYVIPESGKPPERPLSAPGIVIYNSTPYDSPWVKPEKKADDLCGKFQHVVEELSDKWAEYAFVLKMAPKMAPPLTKKGSHFFESVLTPEERNQRSLEGYEELSSNEQRALIASIDKKIRQITPAKVESMGKQMQEFMGGDSLVKLRKGFHSEGNLLKTYKPWGEIWKRYLAETRPRIQKRLAEKKLAPMGVASAQLEIQNEIWDWDFIEGAVLEELLSDPEEVVAQRKIKIEKEVRIHVVEGKILKGATFLRNYEPLGQYLTSEEIEFYENEYRTKFLDNLPESYRPFSASSDVVLDGDTKQLRLLDLNPGYESGYYFPEEDLYTTHRLASELTGESTRFLNEFHDFLDSRMGAEKLRLLKRVYNNFHDFVYGKGEDAYDHESFWDRVLRHYVDDVLKEAPSHEALDQVLNQLHAAGLKSPTIYYQFLNEVQSTTKLRIPEARRAYWVKELNHLAEGEYIASVDKNGLIKLTVKPEEKAEKTEKRRAA